MDGARTITSDCTLKEVTLLWHHMMCFSCIFIHAVIFYQL